MRVLVTIGPTQESIDAMRLITNRSTGELGTLLSLMLATCGHEVIALRGVGTISDPSNLIQACRQVIPFNSTEDLKKIFEKLATVEQIAAIYHVAAVSDFYYPQAGHEKISTRNGSLVLTLEPTPKLLPKLRVWFPKAKIIGWKFEASGDRASAIDAATTQITTCRTDISVVNGPSYGRGFGILTQARILTHCEGRQELCSYLAEQLARGDEENTSLK